MEVCESGKNIKPAANARPPGSCGFNLTGGIVGFTGTLVFSLYVDSMVERKGGAVGRVFSLFSLLQFRLSLLVQNLRYAGKF
jgi:hypothetical protein